MAAIPTRRHPDTPAADSAHYRALFLELDLVSNPICAQLAQVHVAVTPPQGSFWPSLFVSQVSMAELSWPGHRACS